MFTFQDYLFNEFFTLYDKASDPNKDVDDKGTHERFNEQIGAEMDEFMMPLIDNMQKNLLEPLDCFDKFIPYLESMLGYDLGWLWFFTSSLQFRRNLLRIIIRLYQIRGTRWAHDVMFAWLGLTVTVVEVYPDDGTWDDGGTWDNGGVWDTFCPSCTSYSLIVVGTAMSLTSDQIAAIATIVEFNRPINALYTGYVYVGAVTPLPLWTSPILDGSRTEYAITPLVMHSSITFQLPERIMHSIGEELAVVAECNALRATFGMTGHFEIQSNTIVYVQGTGEVWVLDTEFSVLYDHLSVTIASAGTVAPNYFGYYVDGASSRHVVDWADGTVEFKKPIFAGSVLCAHTYAAGATITVKLYHDNLRMGKLTFTPMSTGNYSVSSVAGQFPQSLIWLQLQNQHMASPCSLSTALVGMVNLYTLILQSDRVTAFIPDIFTNTFPALGAINLAANALDATQVDIAFNSFVTNTPAFVPSGVFTIKAQAPAAPPTVASLAARTALISAGWTVITD